MFASKADEKSAGDLMDDEVIAQDYMVKNDMQKQFHSYHQL